MNESCAGAGAILLDGKLLGAKLQQALRGTIESQRQRGVRAPGFATVLVGDNPASKVYIAMKQRVAASLGITIFAKTLPESTSTQELLQVIKQLNADPAIDGILVQQPLPSHIDKFAVLEAVDPAKDVDGLHPLHQGNLSRHTHGFAPCTPAGVLFLIDAAYDALARGGQGAEPFDGAVRVLPRCSLAGKMVVVLGRSILVGAPTATLCLRRDASVLSLHSKSTRVAELCAQADVVVAATGRPGLVTAEHVKKGAVVIDVGISKRSDGTLVGDVDFAAVRSKASVITPVPGGVGPMTVAFLMHNTVRAWANRLGLEQAQDFGW